METLKLFGHTWTVGYGIGDLKESGLSYRQIIEKLHPGIHWYYQEEGDYQGEFFVAGYDKENQWYFIQGSFGSCSGCDWLQAVDTIEGAREFLTHFKKEVIKKPNKEEIIKYMTDTLLNVSWSEGGLKNLIKDVQKSRGYRPKKKPSVTSLNTKVGCWKK